MPTKRKRKSGKKSAAAKHTDPDLVSESIAEEHTTNANGNIPNGNGNAVTIPPATKTITPLSIDLIRFDTTLPYTEIMARLEAEINKAGSDDIMSHLRRTNTQDEFKAVITKFKPGEFLYFSEMPHQRLLQFKDGIKKPACHIYTFGNPMLAQRILSHNLLAGYSIPPRFLITEKDDFSGCTVSYHRPSSVMSVVGGVNDPELEEELKYLDGRIEALAMRITALQTAGAHL